MNKTSTKVIFILVLLYVAAIAFLAMKEPNTNPPLSNEPGQLIAPDGTVIKGPTAPPQPVQNLDQQQDPLQQSTGPTAPPPR